MLWCESLIWSCSCESFWLYVTVCVLQGTVDEREEGDECEENMEVFDDSSSSPSGTLRNYPLTCKVLYSYKVRNQQHTVVWHTITVFFVPIFFAPFSHSLSVSLFVCLTQASQPDELTIDEQEMLEVIEDGDMEDWVKVYFELFLFCSFCCLVLWPCTIPLPCSFHLLCMFLCTFCDFNIKFCVFVYCRLAIRQDRWATSQRNTCSFQPPTASWACSSLWLHSMLDHTPHPIQLSTSYTPTASMETQTVSML